PTSRWPGPGGTSAGPTSTWTPSRCGNGPWSAFNQLTVNNWQRLLAGGYFVPAVGNSDSHHRGQVVGLSQTVYRMASLSTAAVVDAVRGGHCWVAESSAVGL